MKGALQRLRAEIASDRRAMTEQLRELEGLDLRARAARGDLTRAAVALHHAYGAVESILVRVARQLEGSAPEGPDWHQALLGAMGLEIPSTRPAVLAPATVAGLRRLLGFRHFFRHAYAVGLDGERIRELRDVALSVEPSLAADLDRLDAFLGQLAEAADAP